MTKAMMNRQHHKIRIAKRHMLIDAMPSRYKNYAPYLIYDRSVPSVRCETREEAQRAADQMSADFVQIYPVRYLEKPRYIVYARIRIGAPFRQSGKTWELEDAEAAEDLAQYSKNVGRNDKGGSKKPYRRKYNRQHRLAAHKAERLYLKGDDDAADNITFYQYQVGILWDIW